MEVSERAVLNADKRDETEELVADNKSAINCMLCDCDKSDKISKLIILLCLSHSCPFACLISFTKFITHRVDT
jgi:hypothetical protein